MSSVCIRCHLAFLVIISIIIHVQASYTLPKAVWQTIDAQYCYWKKTGFDTYTLTHRENLTESRSKPVLNTSYKLDHNDLRKGRFCLEYNLYNHQSSRLRLSIAGHFFVPHDELNSHCISSNFHSSFPVSFDVSCTRFDPQNLVIEILRASIEDELTSTTPFPDNPSAAEVGDIQYVGVVVGAICIALFTLFSCLTIISARRSNRRESRRRAVPSVSNVEEDDNRPDVVAENAPPSYDAVMAYPALYPPTPQGTPHATPETTPHLSLHRRALLNQHMPVGSLPSSEVDTSQLQRQSLTPTVASDDPDDIPEYPPPPYHSLANGDVSTPIPEDKRDGTIPDLTTGSDDSVGQPSSNISTPSSSITISDRNTPPPSEHENPWVLNNTGSSHLRMRDNNPGGTGEQYNMRSGISDGVQEECNDDESVSRSESSEGNLSHIDEDKRKGSPNGEMQVAIV